MRLLTVWVILLTVIFVRVSLGHDLPPSDYIVDKNPRLEEHGDYDVEEDGKIIRVHRHVWCYATDRDPNGGISIDEWRADDLSPPTTKEPVKPPTKNEDGNRATDEKEDTAHTTDDADTHVATTIPVIETPVAVADTLLQETPQDTSVVTETTDEVSVQSRC